MSNNDSMQWSKRKSTASPFFNDANPGQTQSRISSADGPAGGEIKPTDYLKGTSKNSRYRSRATRLSSNDSGLFSFRFVDVHSRTVRDWQRNQFFEVPYNDGRDRRLS